MRLVTISLLLVLPLTASAQIYKYFDEKGNPVFSNQPPENAAAKKVELPPPNTVAPPAPTQPQPAKQKEEKESRYSRLELTGIPDDEALRANDGTFSVGVLIEPRLRPGHSLRLVLDGQPYGSPSQTPLLQLNNIPRGEHRLAVEVLEKGHVVQQSAPVSFIIQRVSVRNPAK